MCAVQLLAEIPVKTLPKKDLQESRATRTLRLRFKKKERLEGGTHNRSAKPSNATLPPTQTMLLQNRPCNESGKREILAATVSAIPAWFMSAARRADEPTAGDQLHEFETAIIERYDGSGGVLTDRGRGEQDLGDAEPLVAQVEELFLLFRRRRRWWWWLRRSSRYHRR